MPGTSTSAFRVIGADAGRREWRRRSSAWVGEKMPGGADVRTGTDHDVLHLDVLVGLVSDPLTARTVDDRGQSRVAGEDRAVRGAGYAAEHSRSSGRRLV